MKLGANDLDAQFEKHCNLNPDEDVEVAGPLLAAARIHIERLLGFAVDDEIKFPEGAPADLRLAIVMLAADWFNNREATLVGTTATAIPFGVREIIAEHRNYTFGLPDGGLTGG
jgi:hypothetical protein